MSNNKKSDKMPLVAYFCMEYGLESDFRIYAGGLGILAGDYLKGAQEYNYPLIAVGLKWKQGYSDQYIGENGQPYDAFKNNTYDFLADTGVTVNVSIRQRNVICKVLRCDSFNNVTLYLLDTDMPENEDPWITGQLYGWFGEERIAQEMVLGIGGVRALRKLGIKPDIFHFNEGHAVLAALELIREKRNKDQNFYNALEKTKRQIVFTTHTPIIQGNESHYIDRLSYMGAFNGLTAEQMVHIGGAPFNMTIAALQLSKKSNAVSQLHSETANEMWRNVSFNKPILGITNGIHLKTWVDQRIIETLENAEALNSLNSLNSSESSDTSDSLDSKVHPTCISLKDNLLQNFSSKLLSIHQEHKESLISFVKKRTGQVLNKDKIIIGFGRRAASYKRSNLIFKDEEFIAPLLISGEIQIIFSGKSHPLDDSGKRIISDLVTYTKKYPKSIVYLENYDMEIASFMTKGSDIWLNNPVRPLEASGTSGMKAAMNGVPNFSVLDGWWPEVCQHGANGWQIGEGKEYPSWEEHDKYDLISLVSTLKNEILPTFYNDKVKWLDIMKKSIIDTYEMFGTRRMLYEYYTKLYMSK